jgi:hypothetical protein
MDRPGHLAPPFYVKPWKEDMSICLVETVRLIMMERDRLHLQHSAVFFSWTFPHKPLDAAAFKCCIRYCLVMAGIQAAPGSTRFRRGGWWRLSRRSVVSRGLVECLNLLPFLSLPLRYVSLFLCGSIDSRCLFSCYLTFTGWVWLQVKVGTSLVPW